MSAILLPAIRRPSVNLVRYDAAGREVVGATEFTNWLPLTSESMRISDMGLAAGDVISASAEIKSAVSGERTRLGVDFFDISGGGLPGGSVSQYVDAQTYTRHEVDNVTIPTDAAFVLLFAQRESGAGNASIRKGMINRGPTAAAYDIPKRGADAPWLQAAFEFDGNQEEQMYLSGASQTTSYTPFWLMRAAMPPMDGDELREWRHALHRLKKAGNVFRFVPPDYDGPSTGYEGANPVVNGASQTGTSLVCDGVDASTDIVGPGDYASFEVTTAKGNTNVQLRTIASLCTSDASGNVTLELDDPIRLAPADNATVQIQAPVGQFRLLNPRGGVMLDANRVSPFVIDAIEKRFL